MVNDPINIRIVSILSYLQPTVSMGKGILWDANLLVNKVQSSANRFSYSETKSTGGEYILKVEADSAFNYFILKSSYDALSASPLSPSVLKSIDAWNFYSPVTIKASVPADNELYIYTDTSCNLNTQLTTTVNDQNNKQYVQGLQTGMNVQQVITPYSFVRDLNITFSRGSSSLIPQTTNFCQIYLLTKQVSALNLATYRTTFNSYTQQLKIPSSDPYVRTYFNVPPGLWSGPYFRVKIAGRSWVVSIESSTSGVSGTYTLDSSAQSENVGRVVTDQATGTDYQYYSRKMNQNNAGRNTTYRFVAYSTAITSSNLAVYVYNTTNRGGVNDGAAPISTIVAIVVVLFFVFFCCAVVVPVLICILICTGTVAAPACLIGCCGLAIAGSSGGGNKHSVMVINSEQQTYVPVPSPTSPPQTQYVEMQNMPVTPPQPYMPPYAPMPPQPNAPYAPLPHPNPYVPMDQPHVPPYAPHAQQAPPHIQTQMYPQNFAPDQNNAVSPVQYVPPQQQYHQ
ncbi:hypothetical protein AKO1_006115 [Acrasis kona]|uniref:Uncharacterized protein n=1 Tax=Acrasis kona TaxID=1008807 RepID=A0AAW2YHI1_9EUKA